MSYEVDCRDRPAFFISDAHLGGRGTPADHEASLLALLCEVQEQAGALFLLGDLFDFWFEYRHAIPKGTFRVSRCLADCVDSGVPVFYLGGNHDFWVGSFLSDELGVRAFSGPITVRLQGRDIFLAHGDGMGRGDTRYKILRRILRHPLAIAGYRSIHPDLGIPLATGLSNAGREHRHDQDILFPRLLKHVAARHLQGGVTGMVMGHVHDPVHFGSNGLDYLLIGDWLRNLSHVRMEDGVFTLYRKVDGKHEQIPSRPFPEWFVRDRRTDV